MDSTTTRNLGAASFSGLVTIPFQRSETSAAPEPFAAFVQQEPNEGEAATERTEIRFLLDRQNLYVAVICFDSDPQNILVSHSRRDADLGDTDSMRILLDTFNDGQNAFVFGTNPFGIEYDGQTSPFTPDELLGRSVVVKYTRLFDY
jgi:hypothetical protein